jgi:ATP-binding cassette subfamily B protein
MSFSWPLTIRYCCALVQRHRARFFVGLGVILLVNLYQLFPPLVLGWVANLLVSDVPRTHKLYKLIFYATLLGGSMAVVALLRLRAKRYVAGISNEVGRDIRSAGFRQVLARALLHRQEQGAAIAQKINAGAQAFYELNLLLYNELFCSAVLSIAVLALLLVEAPLLALPLTAYLVLFFFTANRFNLRIASLEEERAKALEGSGAVVANTLAGTRTIAALGRSAHMQRLVSSHADRVFEIDQEIRNTSHRLWLTFQCLNGVFAGALLFGLGRLAIHDRLSLGAVMTLMGYVYNLISAQSDILNSWGRLQNCRAAISRLALIYDPRDRSTLRSQQNEVSWSEIALEGVSYCYPGSKTLACCGVTFAVRPGERIALLGPSGSGKTTVAKLLTGVLIPSAGRRLVDGVPHHGPAREFMLALQECQLFSLTLRDNLTLFEEVDAEYFEQIMRLTRLNEVAATLPQGYETIIGEGGAHLSGGELQRLSLARALLMEPTLLVLDEATAMVEGSLEDRLLQGIFTLLPTTAIVLITHHERPLKHFPRVIHMQGVQTQKSS